MKLGKGVSWQTSGGAKASQEVTYSFPEFLQAAFAQVSLKDGNVCSPMSMRRRLEYLLSAGLLLMLMVSNRPCHACNFVSLFNPLLLKKMAVYGTFNNTFCLFELSFEKHGNSVNL